MRFKGTCAMCHSDRKHLAWGICATCYATADAMHKEAARLDAVASKAMEKAARARKDALSFQLAVQRVMATGMGRPFDVRDAVAPLVKAA